MAISLGRHRIRSDKKKAQENLLRQQAAAQEKEGKRKGWSSILGTAGGMALGAGALAVTGLSGGLLAPLVLGAAKSLGKKWADEATKKHSKAQEFKSGSKYGLMREEEKSLTEGLAKSRETDWSLGTMAEDIGMSYLGAGVSGKLTGAGKTLLGGGKGSFGEAMTGTKDWGSKMASGEIGLLTPDAWARTTGIGAKGFGERVTEAAGGVEEEEFWDLASEAPEIGQSYEVPEIGGYGDESIEQLFAKGGKVPSKNEINQLINSLALNVMMGEISKNGASQKTYDDTPLEEVQPTIVEHFASQGKTLGGNDTRSLSQMLGR